MPKSGDSDSGRDCRRHENAGPSWQPKLALDAGDASGACVGQQKAAAGSSHDQLMTEFIRER